MSPTQHVARECAGQGKGQGDVLVRVGAVVFAVGAAATLATVTPLLIGAEPLPTAAYAVSMLMAVGFAIAAAGLLRSVFSQRGGVPARRGTR